MNACWRVYHVHVHTATSPASRSNAKCSSQQKKQQPRIGKSIWKQFNIFGLDNEQTTGKKSCFEPRFCFRFNLFFGLVWKSFMLGAQRDSEQNAKEWIPFSHWNIRENLMRILFLFSIWSDVFYPLIQQLLFVSVCVASVSVYPAKINQLPASLRNSITKIIKHHSTQNEKKMKPNEEKKTLTKKRKSLSTNIGAVWRVFCSCSFFGSSK